MASKTFNHDINLAAGNTFKKAGVEVLGGVFGGQFLSVESLGISTTTATTYQEKLKLTTPSLPAGDYVILWSTDYGNEFSNKSCQVRLQLNDSVLLSDIGSSVAIDDWFLNSSGFSKVTLASGVHEIDIDFQRIAGGGGGDTATIKNARLTLWQVA